MRVALVHDWLTGMRGGERVLEQLLALYPGAEIFTLLHVPGTVSPVIEARRIHSSFVQRLPRAARWYRYYLPLFPAAIERFDVSDFDLVISSSHCVAKGARTAGVPHLCYCHTPMRYIRDQYDAYFGGARAPAWLRVAMRMAAHRLREWDTRTASRVHAFVANSRHVRDRIFRYYGRTSDVVHPPVDVQRFAPAAQREDYYLCLGALVPYKRFDLAVAAFNQLGVPLLVVGDGPDYARLRRDARANITFTGRVGDAEVARLLARARGLVMPMIEDFGISAVEAQAAGTPVLAYAAGGALETVVPYRVGGAAIVNRLYAGSATGILFGEQSAHTIATAVQLRERLEFDTAALRANAARFDVASFERGIRRAVSALLDTAPNSPAPAVA